MIFAVGLLYIFFLQSVFAFGVVVGGGAKGVPHSQLFWSRGKNDRHIMEINFTDSRSDPAQKKTCLLFGYKIGPRTTQHLA